MANIVLIMPDEQRADTLGCTGNPLMQTPNIDRLASEGVAFTNAHCQSPLCQPSRASFLTGRYPHQHGTITNERSFPPPESPNFLHQLQDAGFHTAELGKVHIGVVPRGTPRVPFLKGYGFDEMDEVYGKMAYLRAESEYTELLRKAGVLEDFRRDMLARLAKAQSVATLRITDEEIASVTPKDAWYAGPAPVPAELYMDNYVGDLAVRWIERYDGSKPFFLWVGFCGPHDPFDAPQEFADPYLSRSADIPLGSLEPPEDTPSDAYNGLLNFSRNYSGTARMTADHVRRLRAFYYGNVTLIDRRVGHIVDALSARGLLDDTWIVCTSDHGDQLGDHRLLSKMVMYDGSTKVPLVIRPPGGTSPRVVDDLVELNDAPATILDGLGVEQQQGSEATSLLPYVQGASPDPRQAVFSEVYQFSTVITGEHKYTVETRTGTPALLFDRTADPDEDRNLAGDPDAEPIRGKLYDDRLRPFFAR